MEDITTRTMREIIPGGEIKIVDKDIVVQYGWSGYEQQETTVAGGASLMYDFVYFGYFDLSGYTIDDKTVFPQQVVLQRVGTYGLDKLQTLVNPTETIVVSTTPLSMNDMTIDLTPQYYPPNAGAMKPYPPGSMVSAHSLQQIVLGEQRGFTLDVGASLGRIDQNVTWGLGDSTAGEKLYYARAFRFPRYQNDSAVPAQASYGFQAPDLAIAIPTIIGKESEMEYMMRLQRSVILAKDAGAQLGD